MTLYKPTFESVRHVAANMRLADRDEIHPLWFQFDPAAVAHYLTSAPYVWLAVKDESPVAVFGAIESRPRAWTAFAFGTDDFPKVAPEMTKFLVRKVRPHLFNERGAVRVEAWSHGSHHQAHKWLELLGAKGEPDPEYGPNGETYIRYIMRRSDWELLKAKKARRIVVSGRSLDLASPVAN